MKSIFDYMTEEEYSRYNELMGIAAERKANAPKPERKPRTMTVEQKAAKKQLAIEKLQAQLDALLAVELDNND